jgi:hypothetical protein
MISTRTFFKVKDDAFYKIGREEGEAEGEAKKQMQTAIRMKELGSDTEFISRVFNIPVAEVEKLLNPES